MINFHGEHGGHGDKKMNVPGHSESPEGHTNRINDPHCILAVLAVSAVVNRRFFP
jgi:hypothetical protein